MTTHEEFASRIRMSAVGLGEAGRREADYIIEADAEIERQRAELTRPCPTHAELVAEYGVPPSEEVVNRSQLDELRVIRALLEKLVDQGSTAS